MNRVIPVLLATTLLASAMPSQGASSHTWDDDDPRGDAVGYPVDAGAPAYTDILSAQIWLNKTHIHWNITVAGLEDRDPAGFFAPEYWIEFQFRDTTFHATLVPRNVGSSESFTQTGIYRQEGGSWNLLAESTGSVSDATLQYNMPLENIRTEDGIFPLPGNVVTAINAVVIGDTNSGTYHDGTDYSHGQTWVDTLEFPAGLDLVVPGVAHDGLVVTILNPVRFSNGEATTFQWVVHVYNPEKDHFAGIIKSLSTNAAFIITHPASVKIPAGEERSFSVFVTTPFAHSHGSLEEIELRVEGEGRRGQATLAIQYPAIAQPAGHHNRLYLHGQALGTMVENTGDRWMNTEEDDQAATAHRIANGMGSCVVEGQERSGLGWWFPLQPALRIGLDTRPKETGMLQFDLETKGVVMGGTLFARLVLVDASLPRYAYSPEVSRLVVDEYALAVDVHPMRPGDSMPIQAELPIHAELDLVAPQQEKNLGLLVVYCDAQAFPGGVTATSAGTRGPGGEHFLGGKRMVTLPLNEYHDPIDVVPVEGAIDLIASEALIEAAPGRQVLFELRAHASDRDTLYELRLFGAHAEYAALLSSETIQPQDEGTPVYVSFTVPEEVSLGSAYEVIVEAVNSDDPMDADAVRLVVVVNPNSGRDDSEAIARLVNPTQKAPGMGAAIVGTMLTVGLAFWRRM